METRGTVDGKSDGWPVWTPDGATITFTSSTTGRILMYSIAADGSGPTELLASPDGIEGIPLSWSPDGQGLFYKRSPTEGNPANDTIWTAEIKTKPELRLGKPRKLFDWWGVLFPSRGYDVAPDGQRFLMVEAGPRQEEPVTQLHLTLNWFDELERLVPAN